MTDLDLFRNEFLPAAGKHKRVSMDSWSKSAPADYARWITYRDALLRGEQPQAPSMTTEYGKMLVAAGKLVTADSQPEPPPPDGGKILRLGDFHDGTLTGWYIQAKDPSRVQIVTSPTPPNYKYACKMTVLPGDDNVFGSNLWERAGISSHDDQTFAHEGEESYYAWSVYFPAAENPDGSRGCMCDFHTAPQNTSHPGNTVNTWSQGLGFDFYGEMAPGETTAHYAAGWLDQPLELDRWYEVIMHVKWSVDQSVGFIEIFCDKQRKMAKKRHATLFVQQAGDPSPGQPAWCYWKVQNYRPPASYAQSQVVAGCRITTSWETAIASFPAGTWPSTPPA